MLVQSRSSLCCALAQQTAFHFVPVAAAPACCALQLAQCNASNFLPLAPAHAYVVRCSSLKWLWIWAGPRLPDSPAAMLC